MNCGPPSSSVHGISRQEYWSGLPFPPPGNLPDSGIKPSSSALAGRFFTTLTPPGKPMLCVCVYIYIYIIFLKARSLLCSFCMASCSCFIDETSIPCRVFLLVLLNFCSTPCIFSFPWVHYFMVLVSIYLLKLLGYFFKCLINCPFIFKNWFEPLRAWMEETQPFVRSNSQRTAGPISWSYQFPNGAYTYTQPGQQHPDACTLGSDYGKRILWYSDEIILVNPHF